jgi:hypothetical protein
MNVPVRRLRARARPPSRPDVAILTKHQAFIRALACIACGKPAPSECAHIGMHDAMGLRPKDRYLVPLCGPATVWQDSLPQPQALPRRDSLLGNARHRPARDLASRLWRVSGDVPAGVGIMTRTRQAIAAADAAEEVSSQRRAEPARWRLAARLRPRATAQGRADSEPGCLCEQG